MWSIFPCAFLAICMSSLGKKKLCIPVFCQFSNCVFFLNIAFVNYKLALAMGACHLPLQGLNHVLLLLIFNTPKGVQGGEQK